jgi:HK97 family phage major capsid protein
MLTKQEIDSWSRDRFASELRDRKERLDALKRLSDIRRLTDSEVAEVHELADEAATLEENVPWLTRHPGFPGMSSTPKGFPSSPGWKSGHWGDAVVQRVKDLTPSGSVTVPSLTTGIVRIEDRPVRLLDVIPFGPPLRGTDTYAYMRETVRTHNAAPVAKGARKPVSTYNIEKVEDRARVIAHISEPIARQNLSDVPALGQFVDQALRQGIVLSLDEQVIHGDGLGENFTGFAEDPDRLTILWDTDLITTTRKSITRLEDEEIYSGVFVLNTHVWEELELTADAEANFYLGGPINRAARKLWSSPVVTSSVIDPARGFYVDFAGSTELRERESAQVAWFEGVFDPDKFGAGDGGTDWQANEIRARGEGRFGFAVKRPRGVVEFPVTGV